MRTVLITGGTGGLGRSMISAFIMDADHPRQILTLDRPGSGADIECDIADYTSVKQALEGLKVDILVNNAGITKDGRLINMSYEDWSAVIQTNLTGMFNVTKQILPGMIERKFGRIVNISSINAQKGQFGQTNYSAAKAGVHGFTKALAQEVVKKGITVNTISPGYIGTPMVMAMDEKVRNSIIEQIPVGRLGRPEEIARAVLFLADEDAGYITGSNLSINGGQYMA